MYMTTLARHVAAAAIALTTTGGALAQDNPFAPGWTLDPAASAIRFQSVKNETKVESSSFATFTGRIAADGTAEVSVLLDSVDTAVDLRNVRMRFLFFETFQYPQATITLRLDPADFADLPQVRRKVMMLPYTMDLHGISRTAEAEVAVTLLTDAMVSVTSATPISIPVADFGLEAGVTKLEEAANVKILPSATVTFDFMFARDGAGVQVAAAAPVSETPARAALETPGAFTEEACRGRFEILSRTDNIYFAAGSARLEDRSRPLLDSLVDIVQRCPGLRIEVSGHTDSDGGAQTNQRLSEARAQAVAGYLVRSGVPDTRILTVGYGEARPVAPNDSAANKRRNRRIEFAVTDS